MLAASQVGLRIQGTVTVCINAFAHCFGLERVSLLLRHFTRCKQTTASQDIHRNRSKSIVSSACGLSNLDITPFAGSLEFEGF